MLNKDRCREVSGIARGEERLTPSNCAARGTERICHVGHKY